MDIRRTRSNSATKLSIYVEDKKDMTDIEIGAKEEKEDNVHRQLYLTLLDATTSVFLTAMRTPR